MDRCLVARLLPILCNPQPLAAVMDEVEGAAVVEEEGTTTTTSLAIHRQTRTLVAVHSPLPLPPHKSLLSGLLRQIYRCLQ